MPPIPGPIALPHQTPKELQSQNNTVPHVAAILGIVAAFFTIFHSLPTLIAFWLQWKTFIIAQYQIHRGKPLLSTSQSVQISADKNSQVEQHHQQAASMELRPFRNIPHGKGIFDCQSQHGYGRFSSRLGRSLTG